MLDQWTDLAVIATSSLLSSPSVVEKICGRRILIRSRNQQKLREIWERSAGSLAASAAARGEHSRKARFPASFC